MKSRWQNVCCGTSLYFIFACSSKIFPPLRSYYKLYCSLIFVCCSHKHSALNPRTALFLIITKRVMVIHFRRFGTTCLSHPQGLKMGSIVCPETSVRNYHYSLHYTNAEESSCHLLHCGSLGSCIYSVHSRHIMV